MTGIEAILKVIELGEKFIGSWRGGLLHRSVSTLR
jgi:hypothetical protein